MAVHARAGRTPLIPILEVVLALLVGVGLVLGGWIGWFYVHSSTAGNQLLVQARGRIEAGRQQAGNCAPSSGAVAELVVPGIKLVAPIVEGDGGGQLSDAVGHVPTSVWPGENGTTVLAAHDVTWFHEIDHLGRGAEIEYVSGCRALTYRVQSAQVVKEGAPVADVPGHLALVTCWPLNALWFTGERYLVQAIEVGGATNAPPISLPAPPPVPAVGVPANLASVDSLAANPTPLGSLTITGTPTRTFEESPGPLADAAAAQSVFFAAQRVAEAGNGSDWTVVAPGVPLGNAAPLLGSSVTGFGASLTTTLRVTGNRLTGATISVDEILSGPVAREWRLSATEGFVDRKLVVTALATAPVGSP